MSNYHNSAIMSSGNRRWKDFNDIADWSSAMIPRLIKSFGLEICFPLQYELSGSIKSNTLGTFSFKEENGETYGLICVSPSVLAKKDILAVLLHELIHAHVISSLLLDTHEKIKDADDLVKSATKDAKENNDMSSVNEKMNKCVNIGEDIKKSIESAFDKTQGHQGLFADMCREIGFGGNMTATEAKPALIKRLLALDFE